MTRRAHRLALLASFAATLAVSGHAETGGAKAPAASASGAHPAKAGQPHNVILFVADGLRGAMVDADAAPMMAQIRDQGVNFANAHALFPTFTTTNAAALATGHYPGDTGDWANTIYTMVPIQAAGGSVTPFIESDTVLSDLDAQMTGDYLHEETLLAAARGAGYGTASVGKLGPTLIQDHLAVGGDTTIIVDDLTGKIDPKTGLAAGVPITLQVANAMSATAVRAEVSPVAIPNIEQQQNFVDIFTRMVLPSLQLRGAPFVAVFWSRDPDGSQHAQTDSKGTLVPGINGPTSLKAIQNADNDLTQIRTKLQRLGLDKTTDIIVVSDHGFSTVDKESKTSAAPGLPNGFLAADLAKALALPMFDPDAGAAPVAAGQYPKRGSALLGPDPKQPEAVVAANGGSDLIYLPQKDAASLAPRVVEALLAQDYTSGVFVRDDLGSIPGTLPFSAIGLKGSAVTPAPAIIISFRSFATGCDRPLRCTAAIADTHLETGQGMHGSFSRADTANFQAAIGPDFKSGFVDTAPSSNADIAVTMARILKLKLPSNGKLVGRVLGEALRDGAAAPKVTKDLLRSASGASGLQTVAAIQTVGQTRYVDAAGFPGRTVGLDAEPPAGGK